MDCAVLAQPYNHVSFKRRKNTWYTIASGNWSNPAIWMSNSHRRYDFPQAGDDVSIGFGHTVTVNTAAISIYNLTVAGSLLFDTTARVITVNGNIQATGAVNLSGAAHNLILNGVNNYVVNFTSGTTSTVTYSRVGDQPVMDLSYINLTTQNIGAKILPATAFTINGTTTVSTGSVLSKLDTNQVTFIGALNVTSSGIDFSGNPTIENRGGYTLNSLTSFNSGTSTWSFTTTTQTATITTSTLQFNGNVSVAGAITVNEAGTGIMSLNQPIDCTSASGSVVAKGNIYFNSASSLPSFTTGTFDRTSFANTVGYTMGASITLPYTSYSSLLVSNSGTKTSLGNTTLSGNLSVSNTIAGSAVYELSSFDLSVTGTTSVSTTCKLSKNGAGNVLFVGNLGWVSGSAGVAQIDFSGGNPSVELRGGVTQTNGANDVLKAGTGTWTFTTNNQSITSAGSAGYIVFSAPILISGAITLTVTIGTQGFITYVNTVNGDNAASKLAIGTSGQLYLLSSTMPMATGIFDYNTVATATLGFAFSGNLTIPYTSFANLAIGSTYGTSTGTKTLSGNTSVSGNLTVQGAGISTSVLELSSFDFTVSGVTNSAYQISKTGTGSAMFVGQVNLSQSGFATPSQAINFTGGGSIELRGGLNMQSGTGVNSNGTLTFSTNNQSIQNGGGSGTINCPITISGAITVTYATTGGAIILSSTLNGNNAASTFDNRGTVNYQATQQPMLIGVLQTNLAANTFLYNAAGNQNVAGGTYRTLTLAGSGVKTLQGNVVVATLYTLTAPATLNTNGFTRT